MKMEMPGRSGLVQRLGAARAVRASAADGAAAKVRGPSSPFIEAFRLLAMNVEIAAGRGNRPAVAVISAQRHDGRSPITANLAIALGERRPVLLVAGDAQGSVSTIGLDKRPATDELAPELAHAAAATGHTGVWMLTAPWAAGNHTGTRLSTIIDDAAAAGFFTLVDTPPAATSARAFELAREVGQGLYVAPRRIDDIQMHRRIRDQLQWLNVDVVGIVVHDG